MGPAHARCDASCADVSAQGSGLIARSLPTTSSLHAAIVVGKQLPDAYALLTGRSARQGDARPGTCALCGPRPRTWRCMRHGGAWRSLWVRPGLIHRAPAREEQGSCSALPHLSPPSARRGFRGQIRISVTSSAPIDRAADASVVTRRDRIPSSWRRAGADRSRAHRRPWCGCRSLDPGPP